MGRKKMSAGWIRGEMEEAWIQPGNCSYRLTNATAGRALKLRQVAALQGVCARIENVADRLAGRLANRLVGVLAGREVGRSRKPRRLVAAVDRARSQSKVAIER